MKNKPIESDPFQKLILVCLVCGGDTGKTKDTRKSIVDCEQLFGKDRSKWVVREGLCPRCQKAKDEGCVLMFSDTRGVILKPEAREKFAPEHRDIDAVIKLPEEEMDKILGPRKGGPHE